MKYKVNKNLTKASKLLVTSLIEYYGGTSEVGEKTGMSKQVIHNYKNFGFIPLTSQLYSVAKALKLSVWSLSYSKLHQVFGENSPSFTRVVEETPLLKEVKERIIRVYTK